MKKMKAFNTKVVILKTVKIYFLEFRYKNI